MEQLINIADEGTSLLEPLSWFTINPEVTNVFVQIVIDIKIKKLLINNFNLSQVPKLKVCSSYYCLEKESKPHQFQACVKCKNLKNLAARQHYCCKECQNFFVSKFKVIIYVKMINGFFLQIWIGKNVTKHSMIILIKSCNQK